MTKDIIVLTSSYKHEGRCIAGIDINSGEWIRPISSNRTIEGAVPLDDLKYEDGTMVKIFDVVRITMRHAIPTAVQPENWLYDDDFYWKKLNSSNLNEVVSLRGYDDSQYVFDNTEKRLNQSTASKCGKSLLLLNVINPRIFVKSFETKKISLFFTYKGIEYAFYAVTEPDVLDEYKRKADGFYPLGFKQTVVFSLTEQHTDGMYYKVAAQFLHS